MQVYGNLERAALDLLASDPSAAGDKFTGRLWFNTATSLFKYWDASAIRVLIARDTIDTLTNKTFDAQGTGNSLTNITDTNIKAAAAIAYSKLNLTGNIIDADVKSTAAIALSKLATVTASKALVSDSGGLITPSATTSTEIGYVAGVTSAIQTQINALSQAPSGMVAPYAGRTAPSGWLLADGSNINRTTYATLFAILCPSLGNFTVTIASPGVVTINSHGLHTCERIRLTTTGALPTGLVINTDYYVRKIDANTFQLATSAANAVQGTVINTSGSQSGTHSAQFFGHGSGDGSTTFGVPDMRGKVAAGADAMGGTSASLLTSLTTDATGATATGFGEGLGSSGGKENHQLTTAQLAAHQHLGNGSGTGEFPYKRGSGGVYNDPFIGGTTYDRTVLPVQSIGSDTAHNNVQPTYILNYIIKT